MNMQRGVEELDLDDLEAAVNAQLGQVESAAQEILVAQEDHVDAEAESAQDTQRDVVLLYKPKCLECLHLFPEGGKKVYSGCHFAAGNEDCPAKSLKLVVMVPADRVSDLLVEATLNNDVIRLSELSARLNKKDEAEIERVMSLFREKIAALQPKK